MNSERVETLRQRQLMPYAIGAAFFAVLIGVGSFFYEPSKAADSMAGRKISVKLRSGDYTFAYLDDDHLVDVVRKKGSNVVLVAEDYEHKVTKEEHEIVGVMDPLFRSNASNYVLIRNGLDRGFSQREEEIMRRQRGKR